MAALWPGRVMLELSELGDAAHVSRRTLLRMIHRGELQATRIGQSYRIPRAEAFRLLGLRDPEGDSPAPVTARPRPQLAPVEEALLQSLRG